MDTTEIQIEERPNHRLELRDKGPLVSFREGPYICHNTLVTHAGFLKVTNDVKEPRVFRILPVGGAGSNVGDVIALVTWYFLCVYSCCVIPTSADRYQGYQNYFFDVRSNNTVQLSFLNLKHRRKLQQEIVKRQGKGMVVMLCTKSYWRSRIIYPIVCLTVISVFSFVGIIVQLETMRRIGV
ncbi:uncharacterized protein [Argopecten irradians]|uniref:uncharacterized protein isoform X2 n=1 Tax=Argopecten irradians TaxID=31199 RepID=UPI0037218C0E